MTITTQYNAEMRLSVKAEYKAQLPKRSNHRTVVIELGKEKTVRTLSSEPRGASPRLDYTFNNSLDKENPRASRSIHKIKQKAKPLSLSKRSPNSTIGSKHQE